MENWYNTVPLEELVATRKAKVNEILEERTRLKALGKTDLELEEIPKLRQRRIDEYASIVQYLEELVDLKDKVKI